MSKNILSKLILDEFNNQKETAEERYQAYQTTKLDLINNLNEDERDYLRRKAVELGNNLLVDEMSSLVGKVKSSAYTSIVINPAKRLEDLKIVETIRRMSVFDENENAFLTLEQEENNLNMIIEILTIKNHVEELVAAESSMLDLINNMLNTYHSELQRTSEVDLAASICEIENG